MFHITKYSAQFSSVAQSCPTLRPHESQHTRPPCPSRETEIKTNNEVSPHTSQNDHHQKNLQIINAGEDMDKREPFYTVDGNVN